MTMETANGNATATSTQVTQGNAEGSVMTGSPADPATKAASSTPASGVSPSQTTTAASQEKPVYLGGKKFNSLEELSTYTQSLETKAAIADQIKGAFNPQATQIDPEDVLADKLYENPKEAIKQIRAAAVQEAVQLFDQRTQATDVRRKFFDDYSDLRGHEDLVELYYSRMQKELANEPVPTATLKLANAVRSRIAGIRGQSSSTEELSSGRPVVAGTGSGAPSGASKAPVPQTMADQLKAFQRRGKGQKSATQ